MTSLLNLGKPLIRQLVKPNYTMPKNIATSRRLLSTNESKMNMSNEYSINEIRERLTKLELNANKSRSEQNLPTSFMGSVATGIIAFFILHQFGYSLVHNEKK